MALWMESKNIDLVSSNTTVKVGCFGKTTFEGVTDRESLETALNKAYPHKLNYSDYRIQTNVPEHINSA